MIKYFDGQPSEIIKRLVSVLKPSGDGLLIFESNFTGTLPQISDTDRLCFFKRQREELESIRPLSNEEQQQDRTLAHFSFISNYYEIGRFIPRVSWIRRAKALEIKNHLLERFKEVSHTMGESYPYPTRFCGGNSYFFVCKGLRNIPTNGSNTASSDKPFASEAKENRNIAE